MATVLLTCSCDVDSCVGAEELKSWRLALTGAEDGSACSSVDFLLRADRDDDDDDLEPE
jgi:hypothetical protein